MDGDTVHPRAVAVAIPYSITPDGTKLICLVTSRKHENQYVLPKGGIEDGETAREAAIRELWEEAGLRPDQTASNQTNTKANTISDHKPHKKSKIDDPKEKGFVPRAIYEAYEIQVVKGDPQSELCEWPEKKERKRLWVSFQEAAELIEWRKDIHQLLLLSFLSSY